MVPPKDLAQFSYVRDDRAIYIFGEVDIATAAAFEAAVNEAAALCKELVVDFSSCHYMDSTGLAALTRAVQRHSHISEAIVKEGSNIARLMNITNFSHVLAISVAPQLAAG